MRPHSGSKIAQGLESPWLSVAGEAWYRTSGFGQGPASDMRERMVKTQRWIQMVRHVDSWARREQTLVEAVGGTCTPAGGGHTVPPISSLTTLTTRTRSRLPLLISRRPTLARLHSSSTIKGSCKTKTSNIPRWTSYLRRRLYTQQHWELINIS